MPWPNSSYIVEDAAASLVRLLQSHPSPMDLRVGVVLQDLLGLAFDVIQYRIESGLLETEVAPGPQDPLDVETDPVAPGGVPRLLHS